MNENGIVITGTGAVSPAGWGMGALMAAVRGETDPPTPDPTRESGIEVLRVPAPPPGAHLPRHPRLRRCSPITRFAAAAAMEALDSKLEHASDNPALPDGYRLGIVLCLVNGCIQFSNRFYGEVLEDPRTASPILFPETVFNAPASHIAAMLGTTAMNYTLVGDCSQFLGGLETGADWLVSGQVDGCLVIGAEELDGLSARAMQILEPGATVSEGAGAVFLERREATEGARVELHRITDAFPLTNRQSREQAARKMRRQLAVRHQKSVLIDGTGGMPGLDGEETCAWEAWTRPRWSPRTVLGEGMGASAAWQCVVACEAVREPNRRFEHALVSTVGWNGDAIGAHFGVPKLSHSLRGMREDEQPQEKLERLGAAALSDAELLAVLSRTGTRGMNAVEMGKNMLEEFGSLSAMARRRPEDLMKQKGIGRVKALKFAAALEIGNRIATAPLTREKLDSPEAIYKLLAPEMRSLDRESLRVVLLDTRYHLFKVEKVALGSLNESIAHPREILKPAISFSAYAFILVHNHPSGDPSPSSADRRLTRQVQEAAELMKISMLDHIIIGTPGAQSEGFFSFREMGLM